MKKESRKNQRGITLIALVMTMIIMLILVAVTINLAIEGGLFNYAKSASKETTKEKNMEQKYITLNNDLNYNDLIEHFKEDPKLNPDDGSEPQTGDRYEDGDYIYVYNKYYGGTDKFNPDPIWITNDSQNGWSVRVKDDTKSSYGEMLHSINGKPVNTLYRTFENCKALIIAPEIPKSITNMYATFRFCTAMTTAPIIPMEVENIVETFRECNSLKSYDKSTDSDGDFSNFLVPTSTTQTYTTFAGCTSMVIAPAIPDNVTDMTRAFEGCTSLTAAPIIPNSVTILSSAFRGCTSLTTAPEIPNSVRSLYETFENCTSLTVAPTIPNGVDSLNSAFAGSGLIVAPAIPNSVTSMNGTFMNCTSLTTAPAIPNRVSDIAYTFNGCTSLTTAPTIPSNVRSIYGTFWGCTSLTGTVTINTNTSSYGHCFEDTTQTITLNGSSNKLSAIAATGNNNNVSVAQ